MCLPNFLIIGTAKAGTSTVFEYCRQHPQIFVPAIKEPRFFEFEGIDRSQLHSTDKHTITHLQDYQDLFRPGKSYMARGEATSYYLVSRTAAENIKRYIPDVQLYILVRDPAERAWSHFLYSQQIGRAPLNWTFETAFFSQEESRDFSYKEMGHYKTYISLYDQYFERSQIHILFFDDLVRDPQPFVRLFYASLGVDPRFEPEYGPHFAKSGIPKNRIWHRFLWRKHFLKSGLKWLLPAQARRRLKMRWMNRNLRRPDMPGHLRKMLTEIYREDILWLENRTGRDCSRWLQ